MAERITIPKVFVQECPEVILFEDHTNGCLDIVLGPLTLHVFADDGVPVLKRVTEQPE